MQKQDKALYSQLLTLQESIRSLKCELKKEREECEEAFQDLEECSGAVFQDDVFLEQNLNERNEKDGVSVQKTWKHDRQDSGISVKTPEAEIHELVTTTPKSKQHAQEFDFVKSPTSSPNDKPEVIPDYKQDLNANVKTTNVELRQKKTSNSKPGLIQHSKQDSGILIDEDAVKDTKLLSKLVESSEMLEKLENRKFDRIIQNKWKKVRGNSFTNRGNQTVHHQRSRSSNDLLKSHPQRNLQHQFSTGCLQAKHSHSNSCPQKMIKQFITEGKEGKVENVSSKKSKELEKIKEQKVSHSRTNSCPVIQQITVKNNVKKQQPQVPREVEQPLKPKKQIETSESEKSLHENNQRALNPSLTLPLSAGNASHVSKSVFKQNFIPKHQHTRSLPTTPVREVIVEESLLSKQENKRSMQNISESQVVTMKQLRPRKRSASYVDLGSLGETGGETGIKFGSLTPRKASIVQVNDVKPEKNTALGKVSPELEEKVFKGGDIQNDVLKRAKENDALQQQENTKHNSPATRKTQVTQVESFNVFHQPKNSVAVKESKEGKENSILHKASVVQVNSLPRDTVMSENKTRVIPVIVHTNEHQGYNLTAQNQANDTEELKAAQPLRAVLVSATEVNVSNVTDKQTLSRRRSLDERGTGNNLQRDGPQRRYTLNFKVNGLSPRLRPENGRLSPTFLSPRNHIRHHTMPEYDVMRRRHSLYTFHAPSKSWDGYSNRKPSEVKGITRSISHVSLV